MKKHVFTLMILFGILILSACALENAVSQDTRTYTAASDIHSLDIQINAADLTIEQGNEFAVVSNLKYLSVSESNGTLKILDTARPNSHYTDAVLTLYIPKGTVFDHVSIETGAAKMTVDTLSAGSVELELGAGDVFIASIHVTRKIDIDGGVGTITIADGVLHDLDAEIGVGELDLTAELSGRNDFSFGVGDADLTLVGSRDDYQLDIEKGLGSITIDGEPLSGFSGPVSAQDQIEIECGIGDVNITFQKK